MIKVNIGFKGGDVVAARLSDDEVAGLRSALESGQGWHKLETADGRVDLKVDDVIYISEYSHEPTVGFGGR